MKSKLILSLLLVTAGAVSTFSSKAWFGRYYGSYYGCNSCNQPAYGYSYYNYYPEWYYL